MKTYLSVSQEENGLYGHYECYQAGDKTLDSDLLEDYTVYEHDNGTFIAEHTPTHYAFWSYATLGEALEAVKDKINKKNELDDKIKKEARKFDRIAKRNSLNERYKEKQVEAKKKEVKTTWYLENLMNKARIRTEEIHASIEEARMQRNRKIQMSDYMEALLNH